MVNVKTNILEAIKQNNLNDLAIDQVDQLIEAYPYFQVLYVLKTKWLKYKGENYHGILQQTAARSIDREVLFRHIEQKKAVIRKKESNISANVVVKPVFKPKHKKTEKTKEIQEKKRSGAKKHRISITEKPEAEKLSYTQWLQKFKNPPEKPEKNRQETLDPIERFLKERPKIVPKRHVSVKTPDIVEKSIAEKQMLMTETLANLYVKQKKYDKAIQAFRILSLKYPKKSSYFANQIKEIKQNLK